MIYTTRWCETGLSVFTEQTRRPLSEIKNYSVLSDFYDKLDMKPEFTDTYWCIEDAEADVKLLALNYLPKGIAGISYLDYHDALIRTFMQKNVDEVYLCLHSSSDLQYNSGCAYKEDISQTLTERHGVKINVIGFQHQEHDVVANKMLAKYMIAPSKLCDFLSDFILCIQAMVDFFRDYDEYWVHDGDEEPDYARLYEICKDNQIFVMKSPEEVEELDNDGEYFSELRKMFIS